MKTQFIFLISALMLSLCLCSVAFAQTACPAGMQTVIDPNTNETLCFTKASQANPQIEVPTEVDNESASLTDIGESGFTFDLGLGYGMIAAMNIRLSAGYQFNIPSADGLSFGLYTDFSLRFPYPDTFDWAVVPMLHVYSGNFRVSFGLGVGLIKAFGNYDDFLFDDEDIDNSNKVVRFTVKPEMRVDWFVDNHVLLGLGIDVPLIIYKERDTDYDYYYNQFGDIISTNKTHHSYSRVSPWMSLNFYMGYKF